MKAKCLLFALTLLVAVCVSETAQAAAAGKAVIKNADLFLKAGEKKTGIFATATTFDRGRYDSIEFRTTQGTLTLKNTGGQICVIGRYDTLTNALIWVTEGHGPGFTMGCNYQLSPVENAVFAVGYFSDSTTFRDLSGGRKKAKSSGGTDLFVMRLSYTNGAVAWVKSGGSPTSDVVFAITNQGKTEWHSDTYVKLDGENICVYANFFAPATFGTKSINSGSPPASKPIVKITYRQKDGEVVSVECPKSVP